MNVGRFKDACETAARRLCEGSLKIALHCADVSNIALFCALRKKKTRKDGDFACLIAIRPVTLAVVIDAV